MIRLANNTLINDDKIIYTDYVNGWWYLVFDFNMDKLKLSEQEYHEFLSQYTNNQIK